MQFSTRDETDNKYQRSELTQPARTEQEIFAGDAFINLIGGIVSLYRTDFINSFFSLVHS